MLHERPKMTNSNPFSDPNLPSLEWLRDTIAARYDIPHQRRMDMVSACNMAGRWFDLPLAMIPANAAFLRERFKNFHHIHAGVSKTRVGNVKSLLLAAMREAGLSITLAPYQSKLTPAWQTLYDRISDNYRRPALSRFMRYCSRNDIAPDAVCDGVAAAYLQALETESLIRRPRTNHQTLCRVWNQCTDDIDGWPDLCLTVPRYEDRLYAIGDELLNPALLAEIEAYISHLEGKDLFGGMARPFRPKSIKAVRGNIRRYLSALHHSGFDVSAISTLEEMVAFEVFKVAMKWFWARNGKKTSRSIGEIAWTMRCIAVKHLASDEALAASYKEALTTLRLREPGLSVKNRAALQQFDDAAAAGRFLGLPDLLWRLAEKERGKKAQLRVQSAVAIEILMFAPLRIDNLATLRLDRHFAWIDERLHINLSAEEVKNRLALHYVLPRSTTERVRVYIDNWRCLFLPAANPHIFPGRNNKAKDVSCLRRQIIKHLFDQTGIRLTPHQFRHVAAKLLLDARPGHYEVVRKVLGHKNLATTYEHYAGAETQAAVELFDDVILDLKRGGDGSARNDRHRRPAEVLRQAPDKDDLPFLDPLNLFGKGGAT